MPKGPTPKTYTCPITGLSLTVSQWAEKLNIPKVTFWTRLNRYGESNPKVYLPANPRPLKSKRTESQCQQNLDRIPSPSTWEKENIKMR